MAKHKQLGKSHTGRYYKMQEKYKDHITLDGDAKYLLMDLIELDEDFRMVSKVVREIITCEMDADQIDARLLHLGANLWHTIDHLKRMDIAIRYIWDHPKHERRRGSKRPKTDKGRIKDARGS